MNIKSKEQIDGIKASCKLASDCLVTIEPFLMPGITTMEIDSIIDSYIVKNGGVSASRGYTQEGHTAFPNSVCISVNDIACHGVSGDRKLLDGDIVSVDVATVLNGYYGDTCFTFGVGNISKKLRRLLEISKRAVYVGVHQVRAGNFTGDVGYAIDNYTKNSGYKIVECFTGHGVGIAFHESPVIYHYDCEGKGQGLIFLQNMILTVEPIVTGGSNVVYFNGWNAHTVDKSNCAQFEHTILVTKGEPEILTNSVLWDTVFDK